jgi:exonuclease SbcC
MIPLRLSIKEFLSYQQEAELDFTSFDLACISGANGAGKSAILDAITWALFGRARKKEDDALINSSSQTAEITFEFVYEQDHYRILRSKTRNKTSVLELQLLNQQNEWVNLSEHSLRETEKRIEQTLRMDYDTFINTCFFLQGKADQFAQQPAGKRKEILSNILNLEIWEEYRNAAAIRRRKEENETAAINAWLEEIESELAQEGERLMRLERTSRELELKSALRKEKETVAENARRQSDLLKEQENLLQTQRVNLEDLKRQEKENQALWQARKEELEFFKQILKDEKAILEGYAALTGLRKELERLNELAARFYNLDKQRSEQESLITSERVGLEQAFKNLEDQQDKINALVTKIELLKGQLESVEMELKEMGEKINEKSVAQLQIQDLQQTQSDLLAENKQLRLSMEELKARIEQLKSASAVCPLCGQALTESHRSSLLVGLEKEGKNQGDRYRKNEKAIQTVNEQIDEIKNKLAQLEKIEARKEQLIKNKAVLETEIKSASIEIEGWEKTNLPQLKELQYKLKGQLFAMDAQHFLKEIMAALKTQGYDSQAHEEIRQNELAARGNEEQQRTLEKARASAQPLQREIDLIAKRQTELEENIRQQNEVILKTEERFSQASAVLPNLAQMEMELNVIRSEENELRLETGRAEQEVDVLAKRKSKKEEFLAKREEKAAVISRLELLERAFGRNGVPALLIEQALPDIESKANQILDQLSSGSMSLSFATQRERKYKKDEGAIQTLDILISDAAGKREYELFSGGEAFRINFAIRLALSQALAKRAGARLQTLVIDEGFGSQDADGRQRLIEAINLVMENSPLAGGSERVSDIRKILVITHLDELKDAFPARIEVEKTIKGSVLQVVS